MSQLSEAKPEHVLCRAYGHAWKPTLVKVTANARGKVIEYRPHLVCVRCETLRVQILSARGEIGGNRYVYPEGYLQARGSAERFGRQEVRLEYLDRATRDGKGVLFETQTEPKRERA